MRSGRRLGRSSRRRPRAATLEAILTAQAESHEAHECPGPRHDISDTNPRTGPGELQARSDNTRSYTLHAAGFVIDLDSPTAD